MIAFSPEQLKAVEAQEPRLVIRASAGAGKTRVIVGRYLRAVTVLGYEVDQILTTTFTNKAAAEMKFRITAALREAGNQQAAQAAQGGPIQTLHGFCERVLRANACEVPMDPDFQILSMADASEWTHAALAGAIRSAYASERDLEPLFDNQAGVRDYMSDSPHGRIEVWAAQCLREFRGSTVSLSDLTAWSLDSAAYDRHCRQAFAQWLRATVGVSFDVESPQYFAAIRDAIKTARVEFPNLTPAQADLADQSWESLCGQASSLLRVVASTWKHLEERMHKEARLDFTFLESSCLKLLRENPDIAERIRKQYPVLLVDEAQDLNPIQYAILESLNPASLTLVGDPSQSIYSFRQAAPELFRQFAEEAKVVQLTVNYRSSPPLIQTLDRVFRERWPDHEGMESGRPHSDEGPAVELWNLKHRDWRQVGLEIQRLSGSFDWGDIAVLVRKGRVGIELAGRLRELNIPCRLEGIAETFYSSLEVSDVANLLEALANPTDRFALACLFRSPFVGLSLASVVQFAAQEDPVISPEPPEWLDAREASVWDRWMSWFAGLSQGSSSMPAWELISEALAKLPYLESVGRMESRWQTLANMRKLVQLACEQVGMGGPEFANRIRTIQRMKYRESIAEVGGSQESAVRIMTIHSAKGLEFPCVVLPDVHSYVVPRANQLEIERNRGLVVPVQDDGHKHVRTVLRSFTTPKVRDEEERLLYVAMTRAQQRLCAISSQDIGPANVGGLIWEMFSAPDLGSLPVEWREAWHPSSAQP